MTKNDISLEIAAKLGIHRTVAKDIVQKTLDGIIDVLATEGRLELRNFGVFEVRPKRAYKARNPRTGETVMVPEKKITHFKPGLAMMEKVLANLEKKKPEFSSPPTDNTTESIS